MIMLRALLLAGMLFGVLPSIGLADGQDGHKSTSTSSTYWGQWRATADEEDIRLASGLVAAGQSDPNVSVIPQGGSSQSAVACSNRPSVWAGPSFNSNWISTQADCTADFAGGDYQYSTTFSLASNSGPLSIRGTVLADDSVTVQLNGHTLFSGGGFTQRSAFSSTDSSLFVAGTNTLTFVVNNGGGPTGLNFVANVRQGNAPVAGPRVGGEKDNHGQCVSQFARDKTVRGRDHGKAVSNSARFFCGGNRDD